MMNCNCSVVPRFKYQVNTNSGKADGQPLKADDYLNVGYMAGRFGVNLNGNPYEMNTMQKIDEGVIIDINSCAAPLFEENLSKDGIKFDRIA